MRAVIASVLIALILGVAAPVAAQDPENKVNFNFGAGYTSTLSTAKDYFGGGYNIVVGLTFNINPMIGIQAEYGYNGLGQKQINQVITGPIEVQRPLFGDINMQYGDFNLVVRPPVSGVVRPYFLAGGGVYYRPGKVTTPTAGYIPPYCDPWYYYCWPGGTVVVDQILAEKSTTDFGMNFGGGVNFALGESASVYAEIRYHYIWGPTLTDPTTNQQLKANGQFLPITFGIRF